jgi:hypothetical protein
MRCAANRGIAIDGGLHGIDPDYRCIGAAVRRRRRILGSQSRLLVTKAFLMLRKEQQGRRSHVYRSESTARSQVGSSSAARASIKRTEPSLPISFGPPKILETYGQHMGSTFQKPSCVAPGAAHALFPERSQSGRRAETEKIALLKKHRTVGLFGFSFPIYLLI